MQILSQDTIRRLMNTCETLGAESKTDILDQYAKKLLNSGYSREQARRILLNGIKGYESKKRRRAEEGRGLRCTAEGSRMNRYKNKLLGKTTWYRKSKKSRENPQESRGKSKSKEQNGGGEEQVQYRTVLFVENTEGAELASRLKELTRRLAPRIGFGVKIVERSGSTLRSRFPLNNLWDGAECGRADCVTCTQGAEIIPPCTKSSIVYENICGRCNQGAGGEKDLKEVKDGSLYVGETSRTIYERSKEHWGDWGSRSDKSHILRHQNQEHGGDEAPKFVMRMVKSYRTALSRQIGEAVRIMERGGAGSILNSKSEFDRCRIPRLVMEEEDEEQIEKEQEEDLMNTRAAIEQQAKEWGAEAYDRRKEDDWKNWKMKTTSESQNQKRTNDDDTKTPGRRRKKRRFETLPEGWGEHQEGAMTRMVTPSPVDGLAQPEELGGGGNTLDPDPPLTIIEGGGGHRTPKFKQTSLAQFVSVEKHRPLAATSGDELGQVIDSKEDNLFARKEEPRNLGIEDSQEVSAGINPIKSTIEESKPKIVDQNQSPNENQLLDTAPSSGEKIDCKPDRKGQCEIHRCSMTKLKIPTKKWRDRGGGKGFGWVKIILTKYRCNAGPDAKNTPCLNYPEKAMMSSGQSDLINSGAIQKGKVNTSSAGIK